jgi:hypothetical protein
MKKRKPSYIRVNTSLDRECLRLLNAVARRNGISVSAAVRFCVMQCAKPRASDLLVAGVAQNNAAADGVDSFPWRD